MKGYPSPTCPQCHGSGTILTIYETTTLGVIAYDPCPCTQRKLVEKEEDWTCARSGNKH